MSPPSPEEVEHLLARMGQEETPDPGPAYWAAFPGRVRRRLAGAPPMRASALFRWPVWSALAAGLILVMVWVGMGRDQPGTPASAVQAPADGSAATVADGVLGETRGGDGEEMPPAGRDAEGTPPAGAGESDEPVEAALDTLLGAPDPLQVEGRLEDLSIDEKRELLDILRRELDALNRPGDTDGKPA